MTDFLEPLGEEQRLEMALENPRGFSDVELARRAFQSLGGDTRRNKIIQIALWEIDRRQAEHFQSRSATAAEKSHLEIMGATKEIGSPRGR